LAIEIGKPAFVEASVVLGDLEELEKKAKEKNVFIAPSCTMKFNPAIKKIKEIVDSGKYGKVTNFIYYLGQYLPDWHPWENVKDFYVGKKETGGGREMVPFELTWMTDIFGFPKNIKGYLGKTMDLGADIDDTYAFSIDFGDKYGAVLIDVVSRFATKSLTLNLEKAQILWKWDDDAIKIYDSDTKKWDVVPYIKGHAAEGYNKNIAEEIYINEMKAFIGKVSGTGEFPNSLEEDIKILKLLEEIEKHGKEN
jgi:predicted dehydrogenase